MVWQPLPCDNGKYVWQTFKGEPIVARAASAVTARHSTSKLVSIFGVHYQPLRPGGRGPWLLSCALTLDRAGAVLFKKTQTMLRSAGRQCQLFVIFQMLSWNIFFQIWKLSHVAILKVKHCVFLHLKAYLLRKKNLFFWFFISKILCFVRKLFENPNQNFRKFWYFHFFQKII